MCVGLGQGEANVGGIGQGRYGVIRAGVWHIPWRPVRATSGTDVPLGQTEPTHSGEWDRIGAGLDLISVGVELYGRPKLGCSIGRDLPSSEAVSRRQSGVSIVLWDSYVYAVQNNFCGSMFFFPIL